jgi:REP element-mobilizing transposase RayT
MSQTLVKNFLHITFSTKFRQKLITESIENELFSYIGGVCKALDCFPLKVGGYLDHIHICCNLSKKIALMNLLEEVKSHSSSWIKTKGIEFKNFYWQGGYAAFSVKPDEVNNVINYIANQKYHHEINSFQNELIELLNKNEMEFDERYIWD